MRTTLLARGPLRAATALAAALALAGLPAAAAAASHPAAGDHTRRPTVIHARPQAKPPAPIRATGSAQAAPGRPVRIPRLVRKRPPQRPLARHVAARTVAPHAVRSTTATITASFDGLPGTSSSEGVSVATNGSRTMEVSGKQVTVYDTSGRQVCAQIPLGRLFGTAEPLVDGQVLYDNVHGRFILMSTVKITGNDIPAIWVAASDDSNPCDTWFPDRLTFHGDLLGPGACLVYPSLGQTTGAVLIGLSESDGICHDDNASLAFAIPKDQLLAHTTVSFPVFTASDDRPGIAAVDTAGNPMASSPAGYFLLVTPGSTPFDGYRLYRIDGAGTGNPSFTQQALFTARLAVPPALTLPDTGVTIYLSFDDIIQPSAVSDGSRVWFAHTVDMNTDSSSGAPITVRYGFIDSARNTLQYSEASHAPSSADFNPSVGVGVAPGGVDTVYLNWATANAPAGMPISDTVATLLYSGGSLPFLQAADQVLITGGSPTEDFYFAFWSKVSVDPAVASGTCAAIAQAYWDSSNAPHTRLATVCGPAQVTVPSLSHETAGAAQGALQDAFLTAGTQDTTTACVPAQNHLVTATAPGAGTAAPLGSAVNLTVCNLDVTVPGVLTFGDGAARNAITAAGLTVGTVTMAPSCQAFRGSVLTQDPGAGTQVIRGSTVNLSESTGKQPNGKPCPIT